LVAPLVIRTAFYAHVAVVILLVHTVTRLHAHAHRCVTFVALRYVVTFDGLRWLRVYVGLRLPLLRYLLLHGSVCCVPLRFTFTVTFADWLARLRSRCLLRLHVYTTFATRALRFTLLVATWLRCVYVYVVITLLRLVTLRYTRCLRYVVARCYVYGCYSIYVTLDVALRRTFYVWLRYLRCCYRFTHVVGWLLPVYVPGYFTFTRVTLLIYVTFTHGLVVGLRVTHTVVVTVVCYGFTLRWLVVVTICGSVTLVSTHVVGHTLVTLLRFCVYTFDLRLRLRCVTRLRVCLPLPRLLRCVLVVLRFGWLPVPRAFTTHVLRTHVYVHAVDTLRLRLRLLYVLPRWLRVTFTFVTTGCPRLRLRCGYILRLRSRLVYAPRLRFYTRAHVTLLPRTWFTVTLHLPWFARLRLPHGSRFIVALHTFVPVVTFRCYFTVCCRLRLTLCYYRACLVYVWLPVCVLRFGWFGSRLDRLLRYGYVYGCILPVTHVYVYVRLVVYVRGCGCTPRLLRCWLLPFTTRLIPRLRCGWVVYAIFPGCCCFTHVVYVTFTHRYGCWIAVTPHVVYVAG